MKRKEGFYWIKEGPEFDWIVAEFCKGWRGGYWRLPCDVDNYIDEDNEGILYEINEARILPPHEAE